MKGWKDEYCRLNGLTPIGDDGNQHLIDAPPIKRDIQTGRQADRETYRVVLFQSDPCFSLAEFPPSLAEAIDARSSEKVRGSISTDALPRIASASAAAAGASGAPPLVESSSPYIPVVIRED